MNVLQIVPELNAGGVERTVVEMAEALAAAGHVPHVASAGGRLEDELKAVGTILHIFDVGSKNPLVWPKNERRLMDIITDNDIDIVHARSRAPAWPASGAARKTRTPFLTTYHGIYNARSSLKRKYNSVMASADHVIANSGYTKNHIMKEHGTEADKITVIPRAVDMGRFDLSQLSKSDIDAELTRWDLPLDYVFVLLPGRLTAWKGQGTAIEALALLPKNYALVCMGDAQGRDSYVASLKTKAEKLGLSGRVAFPGHSAHVPAALAAADMVLSTSTDPEAFGRVGAEAQAMQRPIIATAHGGALETVIDGQTGILVPPGDAKALASAIIQAEGWHDYDGAFARAHIQENFSKTRLQTDTLRVYEQLLL